MKLDIVSHAGSDNKPAVVFIHGLGMNKDIWVSPLDSRILGGQFPLRVLLKKMFPKEPDSPETLYDDLRRRDYGVITWSQRRPAGPIDAVVPELDEIVEAAGQMTGAGVILIGHSRGGLVARKYLVKKRTNIRGLITISAPHEGSSIAGLSKYVSPLVSMLEPLVPDGEKGTWSFSIKRIIDFLRSDAIKELLPGSGFFQSLNDVPAGRIYYASIGGTNPTLFSFHNIAVPDAFEKVIPGNLFPEEMKKGRGDGLVTAASSRIPGGIEHHDFERNHAEILFDRDARDTLLRMVGTIL